MIDRSQIGWTTEPSQVRVDAWRVRLFCQAIGEENPVYWDDQAAQRAGLRACLVPPTYLKALEGEHFSSAALLKRLRAPLRGVLHAEQSFQYAGPLYVGDTVEISRRISDIYEKKGGTMTFIVVDSFYAVGAQSIGASCQTIVVRHQVGAL